MHKNECKFVFHAIPSNIKCHTPKRLENAIPLNASLSKTASNATYDQTKVENLKSLLFKDCRDSQTEFINLRTNGRPSGVGVKRKRGQRNDCCSCLYKLNFFMSWTVPTKLLGTIIDDFDHESLKCKSTQGTPYSSLLVGIECHTVQGLPFVEVVCFQCRVHINCRLLSVHD